MKTNLKTYECCILFREIIKGYQGNIKHIIKLYVVAQKDFPQREIFISQHFSDDITGKSFSFSFNI